MAISNMPNNGTPRWRPMSRRGWANCRCRAIDVGLVIKVLEPIWTTKPETASRVRGRIEAVLDWARARGLRQDENPARWKGLLDKLLPSQSRVRAIKHHAALAYAEIPSFMPELRHRPGWRLAPWSS